MSYVVAVTFQLKPGMRNAFLPLIVKNAAASLAHEPGCQAFDVCTEAEVSDEVFLYEVYDSEAAFVAHRKMPHYHAFGAASSDMVADKSVRFYQREHP